jgi:hypothetical protein
MAVQGHESVRWFEELGKVHLPGMKPEVQRTLLHLARGLSRGDIAREEGVEVPTVKRWIETATAEIASHLTLPHQSTGELRGGWVVCHLYCCLAGEMAATA